MVIVFPVKHPAPYARTVCNIPFHTVANILFFLRICAIIWCGEGQNARRGVTIIFG